MKLSRRQLMVSGSATIVALQQAPFWSRAALVIPHGSICQ